MCMYESVCIYVCMGVCVDYCPSVGGGFVGVVCFFFIVFFFFFFVGGGGGGGGAGQKERLDRLTFYTPDFPYLQAGKSVMD